MRTIQRPKLRLEYRYQEPEPFILSVQKGDVWYSVYRFKGLEQALEGFKVAWNVFDSTVTAIEDEIHDVLSGQVS